MGTKFKKGLIGAFTFSSIIALQSPSFAAMMMGSFTFTGYSSYCALNGKPANLPVTANVKINKIKEPDGTEDSGPGSTISFNIPSTPCYTPGWSTIPVDIIGVEFGENWQIKEIELSGLADPKDYGPNPGNGIHAKNGMLVGFLDFMNMTSRMDLTYEDGSTSFFEVNMTRPGTNLPKPQDLNIMKVPEPTSTLSLLALGILGAASTKGRKLKSSSKFPEKETIKVS